MAKYITLDTATKFLNIPVTNEQYQLVAISDIVLIEQASTTTVTIAYGGGKVTTITHATAGAGHNELILPLLSTARKHPNSGCFFILCIFVKRFSNDKFS